MGKRSIHGAFALPFMGGLEAEVALDRIFLELELLGSARVEIRVEHWRRLRPELEHVARSGELLAYWGVFDVQLTPSAGFAPLAKWFGSLVSKTLYDAADSPPDDIERIRQDARAS